MELEKVVQDEFNKIVENGTVQKLIANRLEKTLDDIIEDSLRSYSDFGKNLKTLIGEAIKVDLTKLSLLDYNTIVTSIVKEQLDKTLFESVQQPIADAIGHYTGKLEKAEWKLSEIISEFIDKVVLPDADDERYGEITLHVKRSNWGSIYVSFDKDSDKDESECEFKLNLDKDGTIWSFEAGNYKPHKGDIRKQPIHGSFDGFIFKLYAMKCTLILDESNCETEWSMDEY